VIVPTCNRKQQLRRCLDSLSRQTVGRYEVIVVDDASQDGTGQMVREFAAAHRSCQWIWLENPEHQGANPSRNRGIRHARGQWLAFTDDDCVADPDWLERLLVAFDHPNVAAVTGMVENIAPTNLFELALKGTQRVAGGREATRLVGCNLCLRRGPLLEFLFDEDRAAAAAGGSHTVDMRVSGRGDEEGLFLKLRAAGYQLRMAPGARVVHGHRYSAGSFFKQAFLGGRSAARLVYKYYLPPRLDLLPFLLGYLTLPVAVWNSAYAWLPALLLTAGLLAIAYNEWFRKGKTLLETLVTFPLMIAYYHVRLAAYVLESLRLRFSSHNLRRERLPCANRLA
jgi:GT2 family glycosyltransferase